MKLVKHLIVALLALSPCLFMSWSDVGMAKSACAGCFLRTPEAYYGAYTQDVDLHFTWTLYEGHQDGTCAEHLGATPPCEASPCAFQAKVTVFNDRSEGNLTVKDPTGQSHTVPPEAHITFQRPETPQPIPCSTSGDTVASFTAWFTGESTAHLDFKCTICSNVF